jgi:hypothetical protein
MQKGQERLRQLLDDFDLEASFKEMYGRDQMEKARRLMFFDVPAPMDKTASAPATVSVSTDKDVDVPESFKVVSNVTIQPQQYSASGRVQSVTVSWMPYHLNLNNTWWDHVKDDFSRTLPDEMETIIMLGGHKIPTICIMRTGKRTFEVFFRGKSEADISDIIRANIGGVHPLRKTDTSTMVSRAQWLANHLGCGYGRAKSEPLWKTVVKQGRKLGKKWLKLGQRP